ncbi:MAG: hypothetical protein ACRD27_07840 [Terracidiphilus sp.]
MPAHTIEPETPDAGDAAGERMRKCILDALDVFEELDERIQRGQGYATEDKVYCVYSVSEAQVRERPGERGKRQDRIAEVRRLMQSIAAAGKTGAA